MKTEDIVQQRAEDKCELCGHTEGLKLYTVAPADYTDEKNSLLICPKCQAQVDKKEPLDNNHWQLLTTAMWSEVPGIQVISWRMLHRLKKESWAADSLDMMYLDEETLAWAKTSGDHENETEDLFHRDVNGALLQDGDTVVLTKSLDVKGSTLNAKLGTVVRNIRLVHNNTEQIEGRVEGQLIVILTKYVRKQNP
jgi:protein PhnA